MKLKNEKTVYNAGIFTVSKLFLENEKNEEIIHHTIRFPQTVCILPITNDKKIVFEKQYRSPINKIVLEIPAGKMDFGETPQETMKREIEEETGFYPIKWQEMFFAYITFGYSDEKMHYFIAEVKKKEDNKRKFFPDKDEEIEIVTLSFQEAFEKIKTGEIVDSKTILMLYAYEKEFKNKSW